MTNDKQKDRLVELLIEYDTMRMMRHSIEDCAEQLLSKGKLVPPVKYGDCLYIITEVSKTIVETIVIGVWIYEESFTVLTIHGNILNASFGKTVFLTKEEAEEALSKLQASYKQVNGGVQG